MNTPFSPLHYQRDLSVLQNLLADVFIVCILPWGFNVQVRLLDSASGSATYPAGKVLGLADLGATLPEKQCEKDTYVTDGDNYLDVCLALVEADPAPSVVHLPCGQTTQITAPKGLVAPCVPQSINVTLVL